MLVLFLSSRTAVLKNKILTQHLIITFFTLLVCACESDSQLPAPLGDHAVLEKLAATYDKLRDRLPVSPSGLTPKGKRKFVQEVFQRTGYDYDATLLAAARTPPDHITANHRDMMELLLLPTQGLNEADSQSLYGDSLYKAIEKINALYDQ